MRGALPVRFRMEPNSTCSTEIYETRTDPEMTDSNPGDEPASRQHQVPFTIRLPLDLRDLVEQRASAQGLSSSRIIADLLRDALDGEKVVALSRQSLQATTLLAPALNAATAEMRELFGRVHAELALIRREQRTGFRRLVGFSSYLAGHAGAIWRLVRELRGSPPSEAEKHALNRDIWQLDQRNIVQLHDHAKADAEIGAALGAAKGSGPEGAR